RAVNSILTATYWEIGRRIVEFEQGGKARAEYGEELLRRVAQDLTARHGRGFSRQGLQKMRAFYLGWEICPTPSGKFEDCACRPAELENEAEEICSTVAVKSKIRPTASAESVLEAIFRCRGPTTSVSCRSRSPTPASFMSRKPSAAAGRCASSTGRSARNSSSEPPTRSSRPPCVPAARRPGRKTPSRSRTRSATRTCSNS